MNGTDGHAADEPLNSSERLRLLAATIARLERHGWRLIYSEGTDALLEEPRAIGTGAPFWRVRVKGWLHLNRSRRIPRRMWTVADADGRVYRLVLAPELDELEHRSFLDTACPALPPAGP